MDLAPKWAREAAMLGLELAAKQAFHTGAIGPEELAYYLKRAGELST